MLSLHQINFTDSLTLEEVHISGPPPPARLDHAMCSIQLPTTLVACCEKESKTKASSTDTSMTFCMYVFTCMCTVVLYIHVVFNKININV